MKTFLEKSIEIGYQFVCQIVCRTLFKMPIIIIIMSVVEACIAAHKPRREKKTEQLFNLKYDSMSDSAINIFEMKLEKNRSAHVH